MIQIDSIEYRTVKYYTGTYGDHEFTIKRIEDDNEGGAVELTWTGSAPDVENLAELDREIMDQFVDRL